MHRIRRICCSLARRAEPSDTAEPRASQPTGPAAHRPGRSGRGGFAGRFIQDLAAAASVTATSSPAGEAAGAGPRAAVAGQLAPLGDTQRRPGRTELPHHHNPNVPAAHGAHARPATGTVQLCILHDTQWKRGRSS
jgi:hypothetical protein